MVPLAVGADLLAAILGSLIVVPLRYDAGELVRSLANLSGVGVVLLGGLIWIGVMSAAAAYRPAVLVTRSEHLTRVLPAAFIAWLGVHLAAFALKVAVPFESRLVTGLSLPLTLLMVAVFRLALVRFAATAAYTRRMRGPVLLVGGDVEELTRLAPEFEHNDVYRRAVGVRSLTGFTADQARWVVQDRAYGEVVIAVNGSGLPQAMDAAFACLDAGSTVTLTELGVPHPGLPVAANGGPHLRLRSPATSRIESFFKRAIDLIGASLGLVVLLPLLIGIAIAVRLSSRGPVLHVQRRVGRRGRAFLMYKFRTMKHGNDSREYDDFMTRFIRDGDHASLAPDGSKIYKPVHDPRVTGAGAWLRRSSLDELPQLWNVVRGEMSLVGPRPCLPGEWELYEAWQRRRLDVLPGCTGLWQVRGRSRVRFEEMVMLDLQYVHQGTLCTDLRLILETIPVMLLGRGAY